MPSFGSTLPRVNPGWVVSITNAAVPLCLSSGCTIAKSTIKSATGPLVTHDLRPLMTYVSSFNTAIVFMLPASLPDCGSVNEYAPIFLPDATGTRYFSFCAALPNLYNPWQNNELLTDIMVPCDASALEISSIAKT